MTHVKDLAGAVLALWVARALGYESSSSVPECLCGTWYAGESDGGINEWAPHEDWAQSGPLIDRHHIETAPTYADDGICVKGWVAMMFNNTANPHPPIVEHGRTALIAAMRALVASVYGDTVPDEVAA